MKYDVVIVASGKGNRANLGYNKVFFKMKDQKTVLDHSIDLFCEDKECNKVIVVLNKEDIDLINQNSKVFTILGGKQRKDSVKEGLKLVESEYVFVHDAARPFIQLEAINKLKASLQNNSAVILAKKATDTIKKVKDDKIINTIDRNTIFLAETPQAFNSKLLKECYERADDVNFTDDASLVESLGYDVYIVESTSNNKKLTNPEDFENI